MTTAKDILDKYAHGVVIPKSNETIFFNPYSERQWGVKAKWKTEAYKYQYSKLGFSENICLWIPPKDCLVIEFEGSRQQNEEWIKQTELNCQKYKMQYCVCDHGGKSPYIWIFNIRGL